MDRREVNKALLSTFLMSAMSAPSQAQIVTTIKVGITPTGQPASGLNAKSGTPEGFAVEIIQKVAADAGLSVDFQPMPFGDLQQSLLDRKIDAIAGSYGVTPERQKIVDFTRTYGKFQERLLVKASNPENYKSIADLKGMKVATSRGSSYVKPLQEAGANLSLSANIPESIAKLDAGEVAGVIENETQVNYLLRANPKANLRMVTDYQPIFVGQFSFAVRKGDADLLIKLDRSLAKMEASGIVAAIKKKWGIS